MRSRHFSPAAVIAVLLTLLFGGVAQAAWVVSGSGSGRVAAASLVAPTLTATRSATSPTSAIDLSWTAGGQLAGAGYEVRRNGNLIACTSSPCTDSGLTAGTSYTYVVTVKIGAWTKDSNTASASTDAATAATHYAVSTANSTVTAGQSFPVTLTAKRDDGSTDTTYSGSKAVSWSGTATAGAPAGYSATLPPSVAFANGVGTATVTLTRAGTGTLTAASPGIGAGSTTITVQAGSGSRIALTAITRVSGPTLECHITCTVPNVGNKNNVSARVSLTDAYGNLVKLGGTGSITVIIGGTAKSIDPKLLTIVGGSDTSATSTVANMDSDNTSTLTAVADGYSGVTATLLKNS